MKFSLIRADDQVHLEVETFNLEPVRAGAGYELRPVTAGQPGHIAVTFPQQHVMERVGTIVAPNPPQSGPIFPAGTTRVVFFAPAGHPPIPFTVSGILGALPGLALVTDGAAGTEVEAQDAGASLRASSAELVLDAMRTSPNGVADGAPAGPLLETASAAPGRGLQGRQRGRRRESRRGQRAQRDARGGAPGGAGGPRPGPAQRAGGGGGGGGAAGTERGSASGA